MSRNGGSEKIRHLLFLIGLWSLAFGLWSLVQFRRRGAVAFKSAAFATNNPKMTTNDR